MNDSVLFIKVIKTKNYVPMSFTIVDNLCDICLKYMQARPCSTGRFILRYAKEKYIQQLIGVKAVLHL